MTRQELKLITTFKSLLNERLKGYEVIVFGSRARGDADDDSDLDVLVITEEAETYDLVRWISGCAWEAALGSGVVITPVVFSREEWENGPERSGLLAQAVKREGIPV